MDYCDTREAGWNEKIALFDMDGTLTVPRKHIGPEMVKALFNLSQRCQIGIVSGSNLSSIKEQVLDYLPDVIKSRTVLFPCNSTQVYTFNSGEYKQVYYIDMIDEISVSSFFELHEFLLKQQIVICDDNPDIKIRGNFIENRGSILNYCIPGRSSLDEDRKNFGYIDLTRGIRSQTLTRIKTFIKRKDLNLSASIGGQTSIDIFPKGWDKTYVMNHVGDYDVITFIGDKCEGSGNDKELYNFQDRLDNLVCFKTSSEKETLSIIYNELMTRFSKIPTGILR
tara:strand:+ start:12583 stop:13425 length:843 start_codon:yes stop_codon:yes gene_type:complete